MPQARSKTNPRNSPNACPTLQLHCSGGFSERQHTLAAGLLTKMPTVYQHRPLRRCGYCGAVYERASTTFSDGLTAKYTAPAGTRRAGRASEALSTL